MQQKQQLAIKQTEHRHVNIDANKSTSCLRQHRNTKHIHHHFILFASSYLYQNMTKKLPQHLGVWWTARARRSNSRRRVPILFVPRPPFNHSFHYLRKQWWWEGLTGEGQLVPTPNRCCHCWMSFHFWAASPSFKYPAIYIFKWEWQVQSWEFPWYQPWLGRKGVEIEITQSWFRYFEHNLHSIPSPIPFQLLLKESLNPLESHKSRCS